MTATSSLEGKRALVTGGSRGIGAAIVRRLASRGAAVAVLKQDGQLGATYELGGTPFTVT
jgi:3-oxoacyl-[acyl-carrier protein] reductase